jgi:hypothetical protein
VLKLVGLKTSLPEELEPDGLVVPVLPHAATAMAPTATMPIRPVSPRRDPSAPRPNMFLTIIETSL